jgi:hypothetical protein
VVMLRGSWGCWNTLRWQYSFILTNQLCKDCGPPSTCINNSPVMRESRWFWWTFGKLSVKHLPFSEWHVCSSHHKCDWQVRHLVNIYLMRKWISKGLFGLTSGGPVISCSWEWTWWTSVCAPAGFTHFISSNEVGIPVKWLEFSKFIVNSNLWQYQLWWLGSISDEALQSHSFIKLHLRYNIAWDKA